jgi:cobalt/nickel transport system permease protein
LLILLPSCLTVAIEFSSTPPSDALILARWESFTTFWTTTAHLHTAGELLLRTLAGTGALLFVASTTPFTHLMSAMAQARVPDWLADLMGSMFRMVTVFLEEGHVRQLALAARGGWSSFLGSWRCAGWWICGLFVGALRHTRRATRAMEARCGDGLAKRWYPPRQTQPRAWLWAGVAVLCQIGIVLGIRP